VTHDSFLVLLEIGFMVGGKINGLVLGKSIVLGQGLIPGCGPVPYTLLRHNPRRW